MLSRNLICTFVENQNQTYANQTYPKINLTVILTSGQFSSGGLCVQFRFSLKIINTLPEHWFGYSHVAQQEERALQDDLVSYRVIIMLKTTVLAVLVRRSR